MDHLTKEQVFSDLIKVTLKIHKRARSGYKSIWIFVVCSSPQNLQKIIGICNTCKQKHC